MSQSFSDFELALIALQLDPEAVKSGTEARRLSALQAANAFLLQANEARRLLDQGGFVEAVERAVRRDEEERAMALRGEPSSSYVQLPGEEFDEILTAAAAPQKLLKRKFRGHLNRLKELGYEFFRQEGTGKRKNRPIESVIIRKQAVFQYAKSEIERIRVKDKAHQEKSRAVKKKAR